VGDYRTGVRYANTKGQEKVSCDITGNQSAARKRPARRADVIFSQPMLATPKQSRISLPVKDFVT
jgi:hypothetical protein